MAVAALWLVAVSTIFTVVSLVMIGTSAARLLVFAVIVAVIDAIMPFDFLADGLSQRIQVAQLKHGKMTFGDHPGKV